MARNGSELLSLGIDATLGLVCPSVAQRRSGAGERVSAHPAISLAVTICSLGTA